MTARAESNKQLKLIFGFFAFSNFQGQKSAKLGKNTFGPMVGRTVGPPKVYFIQSILLVSIHIILSFHGEDISSTAYL